MDNDLLKRIKTLEDDVLAFKTRQPIGSDSVRVFTTQSNNIWDTDYTVTEGYPGAPFGQSRFSVRFKSRVQLAPFGRLRVFALVNGSNYVPVGSNNFNSGTTPYVFITSNSITATSEELNDPQLLRYEVWGTGPVGTNFKFKFFIDATDRGRLYWSGF